MNYDKSVEYKIEKHLDLLEMQDEVIEVSENQSAVISKDIVSKEIVNNDFKYARENFYDIIERGRDAMEELLDIARAEESPRAFEVFSQLLKTMTETNEKLLDLHQKKQKLDGENSGPTTQNVTNALFVGSTADLLKMIKQETKK